MNETKDDMQWRPVFLEPYTELFSVSDYGLVRSEKTDRILSTHVQNGYIAITLHNSSEKIKRTISVHILVYRSFNGIEDNKIVNHKDGNKLNCKLDNLEAITRSENGLHAHRTKLNVARRKRILQYDLGEQFVAEFESVTEAGEKLGISRCRVGRLCSGKDVCDKYVLKFKEIDETIAEKPEINAHCKPVIDHPNYYILDTGMIYSLNRNKYLRLGIDSAGYMIIGLCEARKRTNFRVHRLVATHFLEPVEGKNIVNHKDENKANNHVSNLEWTNDSENVIHSLYSGDRVKAVEQYSLKGELLNSFRSVSEAARAVGITTGNVSRVCTGNRNTAKGYIWKFKNSE